MPSTPNFAIPYPCSGDIIDPTVIADWANGIDDALTTASATANLALNRPSVSATSALTGQSFTTGVAADVIFNTIDFSNDITATPGLGTITVTRAGLYHVSGQVNQVSAVTTITRFRPILFVSTGRRVARNVGLPLFPTTNQAPVQVEGLFPCPVGTTFRLQFQWIGTGGPMTAFGSLWINMVSEL